MIELALKWTFPGFRMATLMFRFSSVIFSGYLLSSFAYSKNFMYCFLTACVFFTISWLALAMTREPADYDQVVEANPPPFWHGAREILKRDRNFDWFLSARILSQFATMGFALVAFLLPTIGPETGLILTFMFLIWQGLGGGFTANPWTSMISKIIPAESRGTFFGTQAAIANLFISAAAVGAGYLLSSFAYSQNFIYCFLTACVFFTISWLGDYQGRIFS